MNNATAAFSGIPQVIQYALPTGEELPGNTAQWTVHADRAVLLVHDMQRYFLRPLLSAQSPYRDLVDNIGALRSHCAANRMPVAFTAQPGGMTAEQRGLLRHFWGAGMTKKAADREIIAELHPYAGDRIFTKWRYSAFHASGLDEWMHQQRRDQIIICGVYGHVGVLMTAADAYSHDFETFVVADAIADFTRADHDMTLNYAAARCAVVHTTVGVLADVNRLHQREVGG